MQKALVHIILPNGKKEKLTVENAIETISDAQFLSNEYSYTVQKGDSLIKILSEIGFNSSNVYSISTQINKLYDVSNIYVGQDIKFLFSSKDGGKIKIGDLPDNFTIHIDSKIIDGIYNPSKNNYDLTIYDSGDIERD